MLMSTTRSKALSSIWRTVPYDAMPALASTKSIRPKCLAAASTADCTA